MVISSISLLPMTAPPCNRVQHHRLQLSSLLLFQLTPSTHPSFNILQTQWDLNSIDSTNFLPSYAFIMTSFPSLASLNFTIIKITKFISINSRGPLMLQDTHAAFPQSSESPTHLEDYFIPLLHVHPHVMALPSS